MIKTYFSDFFEVSPGALEQYGAFNISLVNDLPLFIDPFLIFNSSNLVYQQLHAGIIRYLRFLRDKSVAGSVDRGLLTAWYHFGEVKQNWLGYSLVGNQGRGLGSRFARSLNRNLHSIFSSFGEEQITRGSHLEKLCLIESGVGRDTISDFTTNLIKEYLLNYTQTFARDHLQPKFRERVAVDRVRFNYATESWEPGTYDLPYYDGDFVLLTPKNILTKDEMWISKGDLYTSFRQVADSVPNESLRAQINNYFLRVLPEKPSSTEYRMAVDQVVREFPQLIEYYIRRKEDSGAQAIHVSTERVAEVEQLFIRQLGDFLVQLARSTPFYDRPYDTLAETRDRVLYLKDVIENKGGHRIFYVREQPIRREKDLQIMFRLTWFATPSDVSPETDGGRGPVDFKISRGSQDKTLVEFKLASNTHLKRNLEKQVAIYERAHDTHQSLKVILYFTLQELWRVERILRELGCQEEPNIILIDARRDNKPSASRA